MRIGIEAQRIFRRKKHGMDIYALELIRHLQQIDFENDYFIFVKPGEDRCLEETANFKIIEVPGLTYADWEQIQLPLAARKHQLDLLHCTSNTAPIFTNIPLFMTLHDIIYLDQAYLGGSWYQRLGHIYRKWIVPIVYKNASQVFTVSQYERNRISGILGEGAKLSVTYNGVSEKFSPVSRIEVAKVRQRLSLPPRYLFFLGNKAPKKNMKTVLIAYAQYRKAHKNPIPLVIAESDSMFLEQQLTELGISEIRPSIHLTGYLSHDDLPAVYSGATLFLYPSLVESFGIPIIEAMACGTPVITSSTTSMPEIGGDAALCVDPTEPESLAHQIRLLADSPAIREIQRNFGLARAAGFRWNQTAKNTMQHYQRAITRTVSVHTGEPMLSNI